MLGNNRRRMSSLLVVSSLVMLSACAGDSTVESPVDAERSASADTSMPANGRPVQWSAPLIGGGTFDLAQTPLERPVALWFWAPG